MKFKSGVRKLLLILLIFTISLWVFIRKVPDVKTTYLIWNLFLAWIPVFFAVLIVRKERSNIINFILGLFWLFFYPNSLYVITDLIHLSKNTFYYSNPDYVPYSGQSRTLYNMESLPWNNLFTLVIGVFVACSLSFISLYLIQRLIKKKRGNFLSWVFVTITHLLTGYGIYLGRFIRFNSWDLVFETKELVIFILNSINKESLRFTLMFGILSYIIYIIFYSFIKIEDN